MNQRMLTRRQILGFATHLQREEKSKNTCDKYLRDVNAFASFVGDDGITKETVIAYKHKLAEERYAVRSINSMLASLNALFSFLGWQELKVKSVKPLLYRLQRRFRSRCFDYG